MEWQYVSIGLGGLCLVLLVALIASLCTIRRYRRRLRQSCKSTEARADVEGANDRDLQNKQQPLINYSLSPGSSMNPLTPQCRSKSLPNTKLANGEVNSGDIPHSSPEPRHLYAQLDGPKKPEPGNKPIILTQLTVSSPIKRATSVELQSPVSPLAKVNSFQEGDSCSGSLPNVFQSASDEGTCEVSQPRPKHVYAQLEDSTTGDSEQPVKSPKTSEPPKRENGHLHVSRRMGFTDSKGYTYIFPDKPSSLPSSPPSHRRRGTATSAELKDIVRSASSTSSTQSLQLAVPPACTPTKAASLKTRHSPVPPISLPPRPDMSPSISTPSQSNHPLSPLAFSGKSVFQQFSESNKRGSLVIASGTEVPQLPPRTAHTLPVLKPQQPPPSHPLPSVPMSTASSSSPKRENDYLTPAALQEEILSSSYSPYAIASVSTACMDTEETLSPTPLLHSPQTLCGDSNKVFIESPNSSTSTNMPKKRRDRGLLSSVSGDLESFV